MFIFLRCDTCYGGRQKPEVFTNNSLLLLTGKGWYTETELSCGSSNAAGKEKDDVLKGIDSYACTNTGSKRYTFSIYWNGTSGRTPQRSARLPGTGQVQPTPTSAASYARWPCLPQCHGCTHGSLNPRLNMISFEKRIDPIYKENWVENLNSLRGNTSCRGKKHRKHNKNQVHRYNIGQRSTA